MVRRGYEYGFIGQLEYFLKKLGDFPQSYSLH